jgi:hypothetical protein
VTRAVASATIAAAFVIACGGSRTAPPPARPPVASADAGAEAGGSAPTPRVASLDELEARGPTDAPLMKKIAALEITRLAPTSEIAASTDQCLRATFASSRPVRAAFVDETGAQRGDAASATSGTVPPQGPMCMKKGERVRVVFRASDEIGASESVIVRIVVFSAP